MVVQKTLNDLKDRPHDEKKAVAGGIAIAVVMILLIGWGFLFLRKIKQGSINTTLENGAVPTDQFNMNLIKDAAQQLSQGYDNSQDLRDIRDTAAENNAAADTGYSQQTNSTSQQETNQFGTPGSGF
ncbi:hypothetical protein A2765_01795 [Candidatus Kaiserbacteria bacterium RIFCSPHIGHO2_01_FULL_56_24]|uniref:Uncharacterized protein n=1 Tax=Candidatus Kaiserbacteria bacterium RIFCSPHIGHO2_01_FULL_56_24 TaxID=1798487 RepID=A0A1F6DHF6_9BACT|nr:MAG: hypothetical protein A2765_01795 [Candidatus Kaiserbacteria bacterium RIFCSPHIGHO2_01_FULL_56_24]